LVEFQVLHFLAGKTLGVSNLRDNISTASVCILLLSFAPMMSRVQVSIAAGGDSKRVEIACPSSSRTFLLLQALDGRRIARIIPAFHASILGADHGGKVSQDGSSWRERGIAQA
jgi:hypothetical protein